MTEPEAFVEDRRHVRWLKLNRPEATNAVSGDMFGQLNETLKAADDDPRVHVVVLTGVGRAFCSGLDLKQAARGEGIGGSFANTGGARHFSTREISYDFREGVQARKSARRSSGANSRTSPVQVPGRE